MRYIQEQLPEQCRSLAIAPRHKVAFEHFFVGDVVWIVLLTDMPGQKDSAWRLSRKDYWAIQSLHESRDRWVRNRIEPTITCAAKDILSLF